MDGPSRPSLRLRAFEAGEVVAERYRLDRKIGEGGMGVVWAATHTVSKRRVALKFLKSESEDRARRLLREARIAGHLSHASIVEVLDAFSAKGVTVLVMELLDGETLEAHLGRLGALDEADAVRLLTPVLDALASAHRAGIVHRDLKPANIFLCGPEARVKVLDFGIAKMGKGEDLSASASLTQTGSMVGTPHYMAPEQVFGDPDVDARADVWALGVILFECVSGQRPFDAESFGQIIKQVTMGTPRPLPETVTPELRALIERMLARDRAERPRDAAEVREALAVPARPVTHPPGPPGPLGQQPPQARQARPARQGGASRAKVATSGAAFVIVAGVATALWGVDGPRLHSATREDVAGVRSEAAARPGSSADVEASSAERREHAAPTVSLRAAGRPVPATNAPPSATLPGQVHPHSPY